MHEAFWNGLFDTRWEGAPLGQEAIRLVLLGRVLHERHADVAAETLSEAIVEDFIEQHLPICRCYHRRPGRRPEPVRRGLAHLLSMLREAGELSRPRVTRPTYHELLETYCRFLRDDRGLAETAITNYRRYLRDFLISRGAAVTPTELAQLRPEDLLAFGRHRGAVLGVTAWNHLALAWSSFYRWLDLCGHNTKHLGE